MRRLVIFFICLFSLNVFAASNEATYTIQQFSKVFSSVAKQATPAVVYIKAEMPGEMDDFEEQNQIPQDYFGDEFFYRFFGMPNRKTQKQSVSQGSGFFISADGHLLTNAHVVKNSKKITLVLNDGREMAADIVGLDSSSDVAVLKVEGKQFPYLPLGDSDEMDIGEWVMAIGSPFQLQSSVTVGVISAKGRQNLKITDFEDFIQTDAAINPGNSGGPLINLKGEVIGMNTAIVSKSGGYLGIGFAIPSNMIKNVTKQILDSGTVIRGFLGVSLQPLDQDMADAFGLERPEGALVAEVVKGSPADKGGLKQGDIILQYDNTPVKSIGSFRNEISMIKPGTKINLKLNRAGKILVLPVVLGTNSSEVGEGGMSHKIGMEVEPLTPEIAKKLGYSSNEEGVVVSKVKPGSPAAMAGIRPGFLIIQIDHKKILSPDDFYRIVEETKKNKISILAKNGTFARFYSLKVE